MTQFVPVHPGLHEDGHLPFALSQLSPFKQLPHVDEQRLPYEPLGHSATINIHRLEK